MGTTYQVLLKAVTQVGESDPSNMVEGTTWSLPSAPFITIVTPGNGSFLIDFTAPLSDGGTTITNYQYSIDEESTYVAINQTNSPFTITGLTNGVAYTIYLKAINDVGAGPSATPVTATPVAPIPPDAPTYLYAYPGDSKAYIYFTTGSGGTPSNYEYSVDGGAWTTRSPAAITSPIMITGLTNGVTYSITLRAVGGSSSAPVLAIPYAAISGAISTSNASLYFDPNNTSSVPLTLGTMYNLSTAGTLNGTITSGITLQTLGAPINRSVLDFPLYKTVQFGQYNFGTSFTVIVWIYPRTGSNTINGILANAGAGQAPSGFKLAWNWWQADSRAMYTEAGNGSTGFNVASPAGTTTYNAWQHLAFIVDVAGRSIVYMRNGEIVQLTGTNHTAVANIGTNNIRFNIGGFTDGSYTMNAQLGVMKVLSGVTNPDTIHNDYIATKSQFGL